MRIETLTLNLFGQFNDKIFDFGKFKHEKPDFHVIFGPNEAGKTTTMEAYLRLLYGFPNKEKYAFLHDRKSLRVSGALETNAKVLGVSRITSRSGSLRDISDNILPETSVLSLLNGFSEDQYRQLLCLDDETIEKGGDEIVNSKGDIGNLLFSAAAGVSDLTAILERYREKTEQLFKKRASSTTIAKLKKELSDVDAKIREVDVSAFAYQGLRKSKEADGNNVSEQRQKVKCLTREHTELKALKGSFVKFNKIEELTEKLQGQDELPQSLEITSEEVFSLHGEQSILVGEEGLFEQEITDLETALTKIDLNPKNSDIASQLENSNERRSRYVTAYLDLPRRRESLDTISREIAIILKELNVGQQTDLDTLIRTAIEQKQIEQNREDVRDSAKSLKKEISEIEDLKSQIAEVQIKIDCNSVCGFEKISTTELFRSYAVDQLLPKHVRATLEVKQAEVSFEEALNSLQNHSKSFDRVPEIVISSEELNLQVKIFENLTLDIEKFKEKKQDISLALSKQTAKKEVITANAGIVDDNTAFVLLEERKSLWETHKDTLDVQSANAFEKSMLSYDNISDNRIKQSTGLASLRNINIEIAEKLSELENVIENLTALEATKFLRSKELKEYQEKLQLKTDLSPSSFLKWVEKQEITIAAEKLLHRVKNEIDPVLITFNNLVLDLKNGLFLKSQDPESIIGEAKLLVIEEEKYSAAQRDLETEKNNFEKQLKKRIKQHENLEKKHKEAQQKWTTLINKMFLGSVEPDLLVSSLKPLSDLSEVNSRKLLVSRQISAMEKDIKQFNEAVAIICQDIGVVQFDNPLETFQKISEMVLEAQGAETKFKDIQDKLEGAKSNSREIKSKINGINRQVLDYSKSFSSHQNIKTPLDLYKTVKLVEEVIRNRDQLAEIKKEVQTALGVSNISEASEKLDNRSLTDIETELSTCSAELTTANRNLEEANSKFGQSKAHHEQITGEDEVAKLVEIKTSLELEIEESVVDYLKIKFGLIVADAAIRKYRDKHRSSMLGATERAFCELTSGAYKGLETQPEGNSEILLAIDKHGASKQAYDLSKGTRFQLYLALRAAAYEQLISKHNSLPFFCDDIFETFDEDRTRSACKLMQHIGTMGQSIYLTHHRHVVDIAREVCGDDVTIHEI